MLEDRARQEDEIVALRALARSLKEEVEAIKRPSALTLRATRPHEFFKLDLHLEELQAKNVSLEENLETMTRKYARVRAVVQNQLPAYRLAVVKAEAELKSALSQLEEEQDQCDKYRKDIARYKARSSEPICLGSADATTDEALEVRKLNRAREELLRECLSDESSWMKQSSRDNRANPSREAECGLPERLQQEIGTRVSFESQRVEGGTKSLPEHDYSLGDSISSLETELQGLHTSLKIAQSIADLQ